MDMVEFSGHFAQFFGVDNVVEFVPLGAQAALFGRVSLGQGLVQSLETLIVASPGFNLAGKNYSGSWSAADYRRVGSFECGDLQLLIQRARENYVSSAVIARDHTEHDGAFKVDDGPTDLGSVLQL